VGGKIFLFIEDGLIVGRYDGSDAGTDVIGTGDPAAFAIAIDSATGMVSLVQYVSLHHNSPDIGGDIDEVVTLSIPNGAIQATLTLTDGDGDKASASAEIGHRSSSRTTVRPSSSCILTTISSSWPTSPPATRPPPMTSMVRWWRSPA